MLKVWHRFYMNGIKSSPKEPVVCYIGGEDVHMRIPMLLALREYGFRVGAVGSEDGELFSKHGISYHRYVLHREVSPLQDIKTRIQLSALFAEDRPDIVHGFDTKPAIMVPLAGRSAGVPVRVRTITGMGYIFSSKSPKAILLRPIYRYLQRRASSATTITIFQNPDDQVYFRKHKMVKSGCDELVLSAGIDLQGLWSQIHKPDFLQTLSDEIGLTNCFVICLVSRLVKHKGIMEYLKAAKLICNRYPHVKFLLVGPLSSEGKQAVSRSTIDSYCEYVTYLGPRRDVPDLLTLTDLFVLPSYYREGVPRVLLEAGAVGIPLITTDTPGCKEVVIDGLNGLTVPPGNHQALADAIEKILNMNLSERRLMGERSKNHVELNFELTKVASVHAAIYERCLKECII